MIGDASAATLHYSDDCMRAYFAGDWRRTLEAGAEYLANAEPESTEWEVLMLRVVSGKLRALAGRDPEVDIDHCLAIARRGGFRLPVSVVLGYGALCRAITGDPDAATEYLRQLEAHDNGEAPVSREWLPAASHAASLVSEERSVWLRDVLRTVPRPTLWVQAALCTLDGGVAAHQGEYVNAARHFTEAASVYDRMGNVTDATLSATWATRAWHRAGSPGSAIELDQRVQQFAARNEAPGLIALARADWA